MLLVLIVMYIILNNIQTINDWMIGRLARSYRFDLQKCCQGEEVDGHGKQCTDWRLHFGFKISPSEMHGKSDRQNPPWWQQTRSNFPKWFPCV